MAHVPSTLPRGSGERENAIFQAIGATVGSSFRDGPRLAASQVKGRHRILMIHQAVSA